MDNDEFERLRDVNDAVWQKINTEYRHICIALALRDQQTPLHDAEDAFQNTLLEILLMLNNGKLTGIKGELFDFIFWRYLWRLRDICRKNTRTRKQFERLDDDEDCAFFAALSCADEPDMRGEKVDELLPRLTREQRILYGLCISGKYSMAEIAKKLKLNNENTACQAKHYLIEILRKMLREEEGGKD